MSSGRLAGPGSPGRGVSLTIYLAVRGTCPAWPVAVLMCRWTVRGEHRGRCWSPMPLTPGDLRRRAMVQRGRPQSHLPSSYGACGTPTRRVRPALCPLFVFPSLIREASRACVFPTFKLFLCEPFTYGCSSVRCPGAAVELVFLAWPSPSRGPDRMGKTNYSKRWITRLVCR